MAKGRASKTGSIWDLEVARLQEDGIRFRMYRRPRSRAIQIVEYSESKPTKRVRQFSSGGYFWKDENGDVDEQAIKDCAQLCRDAHEQGSWHAAGGSLARTEAKTWPQFASIALKRIRERIVIDGSRKNAEGHLSPRSKEGIPRLTGPVCAQALERWALEKDPETQPRAFRNRKQTLEAINNHANLIKLDDVIANVKKAKGNKKTSYSKDIEAATQKPRAIPDDEPLRLWLKSIEDEFLRMAFAYQATYGLRSSELWHMESIDEDGWLKIGPYTKTGERDAFPVPFEWAKEFNLIEKLGWFNRQLIERGHPRVIQTFKRGNKNVKKCTNNDANGNWHGSHIREGSVPKLWAKAEDSTSPTAERREDGKDWDYCRAYDFRHAFAIRCFGHPETVMIPDEQTAAWMGHTLPVHIKTYRKWMPSDRKRQAMKEMREAYVGKPAESTAVDAPCEMAAVMEELARLKKQNTKLAKANAALVDAMAEDD